MKTLYTLFFVLLLSPAFAQDVELIADKIPLFQGVIKAPSNSSEDIYSTVKEWVVRFYDHPENVVQMDDLGKIVIKGIVEYGYVQRPTTMPCEASYTLMIEIKPERFRYTLEINSASSGLMESLYSIVLADEPYNPSTDQPYRGKQLERALLAKEAHINNLTAFKEQVVYGLVGAVEQAQASEAW